MNYFEKFDAQKEKLSNIMDENGLLYSFNSKSYPMTLTITQDLSMDAQVAMYETETDGVSSRDARLVLTFPVGEIGMRLYGRLIISDNLMGKIKNIGKKMRDLYLQGDFATRMEEERRVQAAFAEQDRPEDYRESIEDDQEESEDDD